MARRRSRKNADAPRRPAVVNQEETSVSGEAPEAPAAAPPVAPAAKKAPKRPEPAGHASSARPATGRAVRLSTCIAGMALTLVLGLYLGTLLPGVLQDMRGRDTAAAPQPMPAPAAAPQAAPQPSPGAGGAHGLPPELAARLASLEAAVRKDPSSAGNWTELGNLFFDAGRVSEAIHAYERSLALAPGNADVLTDLGIMYRENKAPEKAVECFRKAFAADPRHENALFNAGVVLYNDLGRKDEAVAAWRRLLTLNPQARAPDGRTVSEMVRRLEEPIRRQ
ncbi:MULTISPECIES: tetratricopeptide repeat protein [unclassified Desulfovibrio]|uniref:tetratricopeptide repeat protein n=1 Tax=unclassified Desulfovibrio TaxID=2593640 RepID=UPI00197E5B0E|nr:MULTISPECIES: tetratricopeptide repeat protein [unclassified Desulfovibrio]